MCRMRGCHGGKEEGVAGRGGGVAGKRGKQFFKERNGGKKWREMMRGEPGYPYSTTTDASKNRPGLFKQKNSKLLF